MDEDAADLVILLCTRIGMIMEDASVDALTMPSVSPKDREQALAKLASAAGQISALIQAAVSLQSRR